jgi:hypothetical protein
LSDPYNLSQSIVPIKRIFGGGAALAELQESSRPFVQPV